MCGGTEAEEGPTLHELDPFHAYSARVQDVVLSLNMGGGYGNFVTQEIRLYGDGRVEERLFRVNWKLHEFNARTLFSDVAKVDGIVAGLVRGGLVGLTNDDLLALVRSRYQAVTNLLESPDCPTARLEAHLFQRTSRDSDWKPVETRLSIECLDYYSSSYPAVPEACALHELQSKLRDVAREEHRPPAGAP
jgi:hypothetical protein